MNAIVPSQMTWRCKFCAAASPMTVRECQSCGEERGGRASEVVTAVSNTGNGVATTNIVNMGGVHLAPEPEPVYPVYSVPRNSGPTTLEVVTTMAIASLTLAAMSIFAFFVALVIKAYCDVIMALQHTSFLEVLGWTLAGTVASSMLVVIFWRWMKRPSEQERYDLATR